jgi:hypothetical protein
MWYVVNGLILAGLLGAIVFAIGALAFALRRRSRLAGFAASATLLRRCALFGIVTLALGVGLHIGMVRSFDFVNQLPTALLASDVGHERYGGVAIAVLSERSINTTLSHDRASAITDALLGAAWWRDAANVLPFPMQDPVQNWFAIQLEKARLSDEQLGRWLAIVAPPGVFRIESSSEAWHLVGEWGRQWQRSAGTPYRIDSITIMSITVNGDAVAFETLEDADSESRFGWEAPMVRFYYVLPTDARRLGERNDIVVTYRLAIEPGAYGEVGPLEWRGSIVAN